MNKHFVPFYESSELKYLGLDEDCLGYYHNVLGSDNANLFIKETNKEIYRMIKIPEDDYTLAPTFSQAFRFFREKHNMVFYLNMVGVNLYYYVIGTEPFLSFKTYEEVELACLRKLIEIVKNK